jgi:hypothetical protein
VAKTSSGSFGSGKDVIDPLLELAEATRKVSNGKTALIDVQLDIWEARQRQLDNSKNCATVEGQQEENDDDEWMPKIKQTVLLSLNCGDVVLQKNNILNGRRKMENLTVETQVVKTYKFMNLPAIGDGVEKLAEVEGWLLCNWEGEVVQYVKNCPTISSFAPSDKGGLSVFGLNKSGKVIVGMCQYDGIRGSNPVEEKPHFYCKATNCTRCWC